MWTPLHYPFIGGAPRLQNELEGSHSILNLQVYFNFDGGAKINEGGSPEPQLQVPVALRFTAPVFFTCAMLFILAVKVRLPPQQSNLVGTTLWSIAVRDYVLKKIQEKLDHLQF